MSRKFAEFAIAYRFPITVGIVLITLFLGWQVFHLEMYTNFDDLLPQEHPYVKIHNRFRDLFGGANVVQLVVTVKEGDIYDMKTLEKIQRITYAIEKIPGVNYNQLFSISHRKIKNFQASSWGVRAASIMWPSVPKTEEEISNLKHLIHGDETVYGVLVARDGKSALVSATFLEERIDFNVIFKDINEICDAEEDDNTVIYRTGEPILYGWIYHYFGQMLLISLVTILIIVGLLLFYFRSFLFTVIPLTAGFVSCVWGAGFAGLIGSNFDPLIIVIPFLITARTVSHSVQMVERYTEEFDRLGDVKEACIASLAGMLPPGLLGVITDAAGIVVIALIPIPLMHKLAFICGFWALSVIPNAVIMNNILLSFLTSAERSREVEKTRLEKFLWHLGEWTSGRGRWVNLAIIVLLIGGLTLFTTKKLTIGDAHPGSPLLWQDSLYNTSAKAVNQNFPGTDQLSIVIEGTKEKTLYDAAVLKKMEEFQFYLEASPDVGGTLSLADVVSKINMKVNEDNLKWAIVPSSPEAVAQLFWVYTNGGDPSDFDRYTDYNYQYSNIIAFFKDHRGDTIRKAIKRAKDFIAQNPMDGAVFKLAGGLVGVLAATNEVVAEYSEKVRIYIFIIIFLFVAITYRSFVAGCILTFSVALADFISVAIMAYMEIGLNINTLPVASVGVGIGLDYGLYVVSRMEEEYADTEDLGAAIIMGLTTSGKAVTFTATTLIGGIIMWYFLSAVRFQAEMGFLLSLLMFFNMVGAIVVVPTLVAVIKPKFITRS